MTIFKVYSISASIFQVDWTFVTLWKHLWFGGEMKCEQSPSKFDPESCHEKQSIRIFIKKSGDRDRFWTVNMEKLVGSFVVSFDFHLFTMKSIKVRIRVSTSWIDWIASWSKEVITCWANWTCCCCWCATNCSVWNIIWAGTYATIIIIWRAVQVVIIGATAFKISGFIFILF